MKKGIRIMPKEMGGKIIYSPEESDPITPEERAEADAWKADLLKRLAEAGPEQPHVASNNPRINGRNDFDGTEYEEWANNAWAAADKTADDGAGKGE